MLTPTLPCRGDMAHGGSEQPTTCDVRPADVDLVIEAISPGMAIITTRPPPGRRMGPMCATLLDFALGAAAQSVLAPGCAYRTVGSRVTVDNPERDAGGPLEAVARLQMRGPRLIGVSAEVTNDAGTCVARGQLVAFAPRAVDDPRALPPCPTGSEPGRAVLKPDVRSMRCT